MTHINLKREFKTGQRVRWQGKVYQMDQASNLHGKGWLIPLSGQLTKHVQLRHVKPAPRLKRL